MCDSVIDSTVTLQPRGLMEPFHYRERQTVLRGRSGRRPGRPVRHAALSSTARPPSWGRLKALQTAFAEVDPLICYSVKANSNLGILKVMAEHGSGFDVVSAGELYRVGLAGGDRCQDGLRRRGQDRRRDRRRAGSRRVDVQRRERGRARGDRPRGRGDGPGRADRAPGQSRRRPQDPPLHLDRQERIQVRHGHRAVAPSRRSCPRRSTPSG